MPARPASTVVLDWVAAILDRNDPVMAWGMTDEPFRLARAQAWIMANADLPELLNEDRDSVAAALAAPVSTHPLWETFAGSMTIRLRNDLPDLAPPELRRVIEKDEGMSAGPDLEFVALTGEDRPDFRIGETVTVRLFIVRDAELVAGLGHYLPHPGWPPTQEELSLPW